MHDPVDNPSAQTSSLGARASDEAESAMSVTTVPAIAFEAGAGAASDGPEPDHEADRDKSRLVIPTMWR
ncbi:hypothetical protein ACQR16_21330 [Bradyrhizobium oligotrophicum]|uniref:hypothetical protein n=1 Tax=Bradyrhizobium oligotrophicum TaxID=44255 RepID=UPI003EBD49E3